MAQTHRAALAQKYLNLIRATGGGKRCSFALGRLKEGGVEIPVLIISRGKSAGLSNVLGNMSYSSRAHDISARKAKYTFRAAGTLEMVGDRIAAACKPKLSQSELEKGFRAYFKDMGKPFTTEFTGLRDAVEADEDGLSSNPEAEEEDLNPDGTPVAGAGSATPDTSDDEDGGLATPDTSDDEDGGIATPDTSDDEDEGAPTPDASDDEDDRIPASFGRNPDYHAATEAPPRPGGAAHQPRPPVAAAVAAHTQDPADAGYDDTNIPDFEDEPPLLDDVGHNVDTAKAAEEAGLTTWAYQILRDEARALTEILMRMKKAYGLTGGHSEGAIEKKLVNWFQHIVTRDKSLLGQLLPHKVAATLYNESCRFMLGLCDGEKLRDFLGADANSILDAEPKESPSAKRRRRIMEARERAKAEEEIRTLEAKDKEQRTKEEKARLQTLLKEKKEAEDGEAIKTEETLLVSKIFDRAVQRLGELSSLYDLGAASPDRIERIVGANLKDLTDKQDRTRMIGRMTILFQTRYDDEGLLAKLLDLKFLGGAVKIFQEEVLQS